MTERPFRADAREAKGLYDGSITRIVRVVDTEWNYMFRTNDSYPYVSKPLKQETGKDDCVVYSENYTQMCGEPVWFYSWGNSRWLRSPFGVADDRLWVQEEHVAGYSLNEFTDLPDYKNPAAFRVWYRATDDLPYWTDCDGKRNPVPWEPARDMPRALSRTLLDMTDVRPIQARNVTEEDAKALGLIHTRRFGAPAFGITGWVMDDFLNDYTCVLRQLIGPDIWDDNKRVWVGSVKKVD